MRAARTLLRLRFEGGHAWVTVKGPARVSAGGIFEAEEDEEEVAIAPARRAARVGSGLAALGGGVLERLQARFGDLAALEVWGTIENLRRRFALGDGTTLEVDRTRFPGGIVDWELEVECADPAACRAAITALLDRARARYRPQTQTKSERLAHIAETLRP